MKKELSSMERFSKDLLKNYFLYGILFGFVYSIIVAVLMFVFFADIDSEFILALAIIFLQGIAIFLVLDFATRETLKKNVIYKKDIPYITKRFVSYVIILFLISTLLNISDLSKDLSKEVENNSSLKMYDAFSSMLSEEEQSQYELQKKDAIGNYKFQVYFYYISIEIASFVTYMLVMNYEKKILLEHAIDEEPTQIDVKESIEHM
jgi:hypothetical protein